MLWVVPRKHGPLLSSDCGLTIPPSVLVIIFAPLTLVHVMLAIYVITARQPFPPVTDSDPFA